MSSSICSPKRTRLLSPTMTKEFLKQMMKIKEKFKAQKLAGPFSAAQEKRKKKQKKNKKQKKTKQHKNGFNYVQNLPS